MPSYDNHYLMPDSPAWATAVNIAGTTPLSGNPDLTLTWVRDAPEDNVSLDPQDFAGTIHIGHSCYVESLDRLAFHNGCVKLTVVKVNAGPAGQIVIGDKVALQGTAIVAYRSVIIEDHVTFGPNVTIMDSSGHPLTGRGTQDEAERITAAPIRIREHAWIGMNSLILKGVTIGRHAVVGAGSVVRQDVPDYTVVCGNPATVTAKLNPDRPNEVQPHHA